MIRLLAHLLLPSRLQVVYLFSPPRSPVKLKAWPSINHSILSDAFCLLPAPRGPTCHYVITEDDR
jgi:hypothetical protein